MAVSIAASHVFLTTWASYLLYWIKRSCRWRLCRAWACSHLLSCHAYRYCHRIFPNVIFTRIVLSKYIHKDSCNVLDLMTYKTRPLRVFDIQTVLIKWWTDHFLIFQSCSMKVDGTGGDSAFFTAVSISTKVYEQLIEHPHSLSTRWHIRK